MPAHLFGSITLPTDLDHVVDFHRLHLGLGAGTSTVLDGWRATVERYLNEGPMALMDCALEHLDHFAEDAPQAVEELLGSAWPETVALGVACHALLTEHRLPAQAAQLSLPRWLLELDSRNVVQASVRDESPHPGPVPWIVELDFGRATIGCANVWINPDGSLYQLNLTDETIDEVEECLHEINHRVPNHAFVRVTPAGALDAFSPPARHAETDSWERAVLEWLLRSGPRSHNDRN